MSENQTHAQLLEFTARQLSEQGYDVIIEPNSSFLPPSLKGWRPDAVAIGREPKLIVEIVSEGPRSAERVAELQSKLRGEPDWKLHLVVSRTSGASTIDRYNDSQMAKVLERIPAVAEIDTRAALLMTWAVFEAFCRDRDPQDFARPQSPGRLIEKLAAKGDLTPSEAAFLRTLAQHRNKFVHGGLEEFVTEQEVAQFLSIIRQLVKSVLPFGGGEIEMF